MAAGKWTGNAPRVAGTPVRPGGLRRAGPALSPWVFVRRAMAVPAALLFAGPLLVLQAAPAAAAEAQSPATLYETHCSACHGPDGRGVLPGAPDFRRPDALAKPNRTLVRAIRDGKGTMPAYYGVLNDSEMRRLVDYLRRFN
jgi:mono/diheme cytochrome c family protein